MHGSAACGYHHLSAAARRTPALTLVTVDTSHAVPQVLNLHQSLRSQDLGSNLTREVTLNSKSSFQCPSLLTKSRSTCNLQGYISVLTEDF